jgi:hypothetical protein
MMMFLIHNSKNTKSVNSIILRVVRFLRYSHEVIKSPAPGFKYRSYEGDDDEKTAEEQAQTHQ